MKELIADYCRQLKWGNSIVENYQGLEADTHEEFLLKLLKMELSNREMTRKNRYLKQAGFDMMKTFQGYEFDQVQIPASITLDELKNADFIEKKENLILYGAVGTGKTHMATAVGVAACNRGKKVKFYRTAALVNDLIDAKAKGNLSRFLKQLEKADLLICDEWGYIPLDRQGAQLLFQVVSSCYEKKSLIITTNLEFSKWNGIFFDEKLTSAIIDRLVHYSHLLVFSGKSYRLEHS
uniref:IS21-like element helper ATPase IstB n=1 Tax=Syntrophomonas palmitatica TaxID=402877 RepID=UPI0006D07491